MTPWKLPSSPHQSRLRGKGDALGDLTDGTTCAPRAAIATRSSPRSEDAEGLIMNARPEWRNWQTQET